jgi:hypothetical protein
MIEYQRTCLDVENSLCGAETNTEKKDKLKCELMNIIIPSQNNHVV